MGRSSTTVQKNDPWGPAQPFILEGLRSASDMWNENPNQFVIQPWMGSSVAAENPALQAARDAMGGFQYQGPPTPQLPDLPAPSPTGGGGGGGGGGTSPTVGGWYVGDRRFNSEAEARRYARNTLGIEIYVPVYTPPSSGTQNNPSPTTVFGQPVSSQTAQQPSATSTANDPEWLATIKRWQAGQLPAQNPDQWGGIKQAILGGGPAPTTQQAAAQNATQTLRTAGPMAATQAAAQPSGDNLVSRQIGLANQAQQGVNQIGNLAASNPFDPRFNQGINLGMNQTNDPRFNQGVNVALNQSNDPRFNQGINLAMNQSNDARFNRAINNMTGDGYDQRLRDQLRENVNASVMPGLNATFANSGMTGSGLHQQNLAKGLSAGMANAEAEFLNRAQDRQFQAGLAGQSALEAARQRALSAGSASQSALEAARQRALSAGTASQGALEAARQRALAAGGMAQDAGMNNREQALRAFGMNNQMQQGAYNPYLQQQAVGEARTRDRQQQIAADILAYNQAQAGPIDAINNYLSLTSGLGSDFGSSASTSRNNPGLFGILGGLGQMLPFF